MALLGTKWVARGEGANVENLCGIGNLVPLFTIRRFKTNLALTGRPIQDYDKERIEAAVADAERANARILHP